VYYLNSKAIWKYFRVCETGKTKKNISKVYIRNLPILLDLDKQEEMLKKITRIEESISKIRSELKIYEMLREDITDKFLVGQ
jgi:DNA-binding transcriptional regulator GbsR (MarR family)